MAQTVSQPRPAAVAAVLARSASWTSARRKSDGRPFFFIPGNTAGAVYMADATACTCIGFNRRGLCTHSIAAGIVAEGQTTSTRPVEAVADHLARLQAELAERRRVCLLIGYTPDDLDEDPKYTRLLEQIGKVADTLGQTAQVAA